MNVEDKAKRLQWQSRRGMWELDLMLVPFVRDCFTQLSEEDQLRYEKLLECEDQDLFVWLMKREVPAVSEHKEMVEKILAYSENADLSVFRNL